MYDHKKSYSEGIMSESQKWHLCFLLEKYPMDHPIIIDQLTELDIIRGIKSRSPERTLTDDVEHLNKIIDNFIKQYEMPS